MKVAILSSFPLHVIPEFGAAKPPGGHYATWFPQLAEAFTEYPGLDVHWVVLSSEVAAPRTILWHGQHFHILPTALKGRAKGLFLPDLKAIQACLDELQPQLVHGWGTEDVHALAAILSGFPHLVSIQGILSHYMLKNIMHPREYFQAMLEMVVLYKAHWISTESEWARQRVLRRNPWASVKVVEYGVDYRFLGLDWCPDPKVPVALFVGSLVPRKGIQDLIAAFSDPALAHVELWVAGDTRGSWAERLKASASPNVKWLGRRGVKEVGELMRRAWCLAIPTRADTGPTVVKEARMVGLPVITTRCGGQTTYIEEGKNGYYAAPGDIGALTKNLKVFFSDFDRCKAMGAYRHQEQREILHPKQTAKAFFDLYQQIA